MYVNSGLLMAVKNGSELAGVISHEMGYRDRAPRRQERKQGARHRLVAQVFYPRLRILTGNPYLPTPAAWRASRGHLTISSFTRDAGARGRRASRSRPWSTRAGTPRAW
jgi:predicted Zn-dependent protease